MRARDGGTQIQVFDTTLRDGQQCPGAGMNFEANLEYARLAALLRIDVVEAGFPSASKLDFEIVHRIAELYGSLESAPVVAALCQLREEQIAVTIDSLRPAIAKRRARLHTYLPVAPELMNASLGADANNKPLLIERLSKSVAQAIAAGLEVEFSPEGYSRMDENFDFVTDLILAAVEAGATVINCPDTIGGSFRFEGNGYFVDAMNRHAAIVERALPGRNVVWSAHCHNDFGLAVANTMEAVFSGPVRQIEGCINGIGERAGNAAIEQCVMILRSFGERDPRRFFTQIKADELQRVSDFVSKQMLPRQPHFPITGENAARHSSGGHTNAVLKNPLAYQPFAPSEVGGEISLLFGPLSGGNHAKSIIERFGYRCEDQEKAEVAQYLKDLYADRRKGITDTELLEGYVKFRSPVKIHGFEYGRESDGARVRFNGQFFGENGEFSSVSSGADSALAAFKVAIDQKFGGSEIRRHQSRSIGEGISALSHSSIVITLDDGSEFEGVGEDRDIEISALRALADAVNRAWVEQNCKRRSLAESALVDGIEVSTSDETGVHPKGSRSDVERPQDPTNASLRV